MAVTQEVIETSRARLAAGDNTAWWSDLEFGVHRLIAVIMFKASTSAPGPDSLCFAHVQPLLTTAVRRAMFLEVVQFFCRRVLWRTRTPSRWNIGLQSNHTAQG